MTALPARLDTARRSLVRQWRALGDGAKIDALFGGAGRDELDFLPAALEIVEAPPSPAARVTGYAIVALVALTLLWGFIGKVDMTATAPGEVASDGGGKTIQPLDAARVEAILVHDGQSVPAGAVLLRLQPTEAQADRDMLRGQLAAERLEVARLRTTALGEPFAVPPGADPAAARLARQQAQDDVAARDAKLAELDRVVVEKQAELAGGHADLDRLNALSKVADKRLGIYEVLARKGFTSDLRMVDAEGQARDASASIAAQKQRMPGIAAALAAARSDRAGTAADIRQKALADLAEASAKADSLQNQLDKAASHLAGMTLRAPVAGTVQELAVHTIGGVVQPGQPVMRLTPAGGGVEVRARLENRDVGFVRAGMPAEVKIDSFPFTRYGTVPAVVVSVSADAVTPAFDPAHPNAAAGAPVYAARLRLLRPVIRVDGAERAITPGMAVVAEIKTGRRRLVDYVLSPVQRVFAEAGHEQ
jgi:hemolysin D